MHVLEKKNDLMFLSFCIWERFTCCMFCLQCW